MTGHASMRPLIVSASAPRDADRATDAACANGRADGRSTTPMLDRDAWRLRVFGRCAAPLDINWAQLMELPQIDLQCNPHCPGGRAATVRVFTGVPARVFIDLVQPDDEAQVVNLHTAAGAGDSWSTTIERAEFTRSDSLLAWMCDGHALSPQQGAPLRAVLPSLNRHSSVKWLTGIELVDTAYKAPQ